MRTDSDLAPTADPHPLDAISQPRDRLALTQVHGALDATLQAIAASEVQVVANRDHVAGLGDGTVADREVLDLDAFAGGHATQRNGRKSSRQRRDA
jgi:hypothetical protein